MIGHLWRPISNDDDNDLQKEERGLVSNWILASCQPHRIISVRNDEKWTKRKKNGRGTKKRVEGGGGRGRREPGKGKRTKQTAE